MSCLRWESNWCAGCDYYLKCSFLDSVRSFCGGSCTFCIEQYACSLSGRAEYQARSQSLQCFFLSTDLFAIVWVCIQSIYSMTIVDSRLEEKNVKNTFYVSYVISSFGYNDFPHLVLPLVSWKPSSSSWKTSAWTKQRLYVQTSCFSKYRGECLPGFYMEGTYSTWRLVFHVSSGAFDHFNKAV